MRAPQLAVDGDAVKVVIRCARCWRLCLSFVMQSSADEFPVAAPSECRFCGTDRFDISMSSDLASPILPVGLQSVGSTRHTMGGR